MTVPGMSRSSQHLNDRAAKQARRSIEGADTFTFDYPHPTFSRQESNPSQWDSSHSPAIKQSASDLARSGSQPQLTISPLAYQRPSVTGVSPDFDQQFSGRLSGTTSQQSPGTYGPLRSPPSAQAPLPDPVLFDSGASSLPQVPQLWASPSVSSESQFGQQSSSSYATTPAESHASPNEGPPTRRSRKSSPNEVPIFRQSSTTGMSSFADYSAANDFATSLGFDSQSTRPAVDFDPELFGTYRESRETTLGVPDYDSFLNGGYDDFSTVDQYGSGATSYHDPTLLPDTTAHLTPPAFVMNKVTSAEQPTGGYLDLNDVW